VQSTLIPSHPVRMPFLPAGAVTGIGSLPLTSVPAAIRSVAEFSPEIPFWPQMPRLSEGESIIGQGLGIVAELIEPRNEGYGYQVKAGRLDLVLEILHRSSGELTPENAAGFRAFEQALSSDLFGSAVAVKGQIEGPITLSAYLFHRGRPFLSDPALFAAIAFHVSQIICWQIDRLKSAGLPVLLFVDEPALCLEAPSLTRSQKNTGSTPWRPRSRTREFAEPTLDCTAARRDPSSACAAQDRISFPSMPIRDLTGFLRIGMRLTSCNKEERLLMG
jgi:hypothetical protein